MAAKIRTRLYEVLIRFGPEGFSGAHVVDVDEMVDGKTVIPVREHLPRPVTAAELGELLTPQVAKLMEEVNATRAFADRTLEKLALSRAEAERLTAREGHLKEQLEAAVKGGRALADAVKRMAPAAAAYEALQAAAGKADAAPERTA